VLAGIDHGALVTLADDVLSINGWLATAKIAGG